MPRPLLLSLAVLALAAGCDATAPALPDVPGTLAPPATPEARRRFVPLQDGNTWSYEPVASGERAFQVSMTQTTRDGRPAFALNSHYGAYNLTHYTYTDAGLRRVRTDAAGRVTHERLFRYDLQPAVAAGVPDHPDWSFTTRVLGPEASIATPAGTFVALALETTWTDGGGVVMREAEYVAEGVGVVRYVQTYRSEAPVQWDLTAYRVGASPEAP